MILSGSNRFLGFVFMISSLFVSSVMAADAPAGSPQDVLTYHYNNLRTSWYSAETQLNASNVNPTKFGLLNTVVLDGRVDAQPLYVSQQTILNKGVHNVVYVATENNSIYAIDADTGKSLWRKNFGKPVPYSYKSFDDNVFPVMGILSTPVIDRTLGNLYFVTDTYNGKTDTFRLRAISLSSGQAATKPAVIKFSAILADGSMWKFNPKFHLQRPGLLEANGAIYVAFGSNGDINPDQSRGSIVRYNATSLLPMGGDVTDTWDPVHSTYLLSSIWQSGYAPAADANGDVYFSTGNSDPGFASYSQSFNHPDSIVHMAGDLNSLVDSFTPSNYFQLDQSDLDLGSAGMILLPDQPGSIPHLAVGGSKDGRAFLMNRDHLGGYTPSGPDNVIQTVNQGNCWCGPAFYVGADGKSYVLTAGGNGVTSWQLQTSPSVKLTAKGTTGTFYTNGLPDFGGVIPVVSSNGTAAGTAIVWFIQKPQFSSDSDPGAPLTLQAFDATNLVTPLFTAPAGTWTHAVNSNANTVPTVANGKVYIGSNKQLQIFGLLPPKNGLARAALPQSIATSTPDVVTCAPGATAATALGSSSSLHQIYGTVCKASGSEVQLSLRSGRSIAIDISNAFARHQRVALTPGRNVRMNVTVDEKGTVHAVKVSPAHTLSPLTPKDR
ncbi:MAG: PQQ-binding-like beta-propeller repeat protein [Acidobacteria bacterium]|nr:PQQ-binding-like beta-propeller repeat protein [Acidobacteriota bacterium]